MAHDPRTRNRALESWLRLTLTPGLGGEGQRALLKAFGPAPNIFAATLAELARVVARELAERILGNEPKREIEAALAWAAEPGNRLIALGDEEYPAALLEIHDPPTLLYASGRVELLSRPALAVVGARSATAGGLGDAQRFARALAGAGLTVVSGLALGIDSAAHRGALGQPGSTIAVLGTGIDRVYPASNRALAHEIAQAGLIVSEFPLGTAVRPANFPRRNRVISGLARGVLVVEAALGSGSLITARLALEQGREVFAMPGSIHSPLAKGCHRLIKQGAKLVEEVNDILEELHLAPLATPAESAAQGCEDPLLAALGFDPCDADTLASRTGLPPGRLAARLLELELAGSVASLPGGRWQRLR
ncbi:MAG: DNA-processing protein DprA [Rhodocyclaceae bacterium]